MDRCQVNIAIIEPSAIIHEGLSNLLLKKECHFSILKLESLDELTFLLGSTGIQLVIINPTLIINKENDFARLQKRYEPVKWIGLIYSYHDYGLVSRFDELIHIHDNAKAILAKINGVIDRCKCHDNRRQKELTEREIEVLLQLVNGLSNKEIADKLTISIHTVISHRKNIMEKTGIKSLSGLTIYAISKKIMSLGGS